ncbi:hypothetical protein [uncultured Cohaesibacter sp.]|uniref:hypothetical protein n=1 Tax=uncultured Cohaesibacter sp. TaxID=1002546 RepID=UPI0029C8AF49|nr:hypothetical protein [uncultured Cohaesibacter sp.]
MAFTNEDARLHRPQLPLKPAQKQPQGQATGMKISHDSWKNFSHTEVECQIVKNSILHKLQKNQATWSNKKQSQHFEAFKFIIKYHYKTIESHLLIAKPTSLRKSPTEKRINKYELLPLAIKTSLEIDFTRAMHR